MAPQQNSTLIDSNLDACPSLISLPEELQRYSPILPPKDERHEHRQRNAQQSEAKAKAEQKENQDNNNNDNNYFDNKITPFEQCRNLQSGELGHAAQFNERQVAAALGRKTHQKYCKNGCYCYRTGVAEGGARRCRSVSLYGINSTVEQGNKEIPIWLDNEPRYVSGVTNKTTCNDIIKALIDDEIRNSNGTMERDGGVVVTAAATASRDYSDYVITESWRGIERSYDGNMAILPVWRAWTRVHNEIRLSMKHYKDIRNPQLDKIQIDNNAKSIAKQSCAFLQCLKNLFRFGKHKHSSNKKDSNRVGAQIKKKTKENCLLKDDKQSIPDEFFFVILPEHIYEKEIGADGKSSHRSHSKNLKKISSDQSAEAHKKLSKKKLYKLAESKRGIQSKRTNRRHQSDLQRGPAQIPTTAAVNTCIRRRSKDGKIRDSMRHRLAKRYAEINTLYDREYELTKQLTKKCKLYKLQNALYTNPPTLQMELSVGQIQHNVERCAEEIIQTEHELLELKNEIKQDISLINNLKRMAIQGGTPTTNEKCKGSQATTDLPYEKHKVQGDMQFVDNIYEFCDNNASMLV